MARLTDQQIEDVIVAYSHGKAVKRLSEEYGVRPQTISAIIHAQTAKARDVYGRLGIDPPPLPQPEDLGGESGVPMTVPESVIDGIREMSVTMPLDTAITKLTTVAQAIYGDQENTARQKAMKQRIRNSLRRK